MIRRFRRRIMRLLFADVLDDAAAWAEADSAYMMHAFKEPVSSSTTSCALWRAVISARERYMEGRFGFKWPWLPKEKQDAYRESISKVHSSPGRPSPG